MGRKKGRPPKRPSKVESLGNSTVAPLASSSLVENEPCTMEDDEFNDWIVAQYMSFKNEYTRKFEELMKSFDPELLKLPFDDAMRAILKDDESKMKQTDESNKENNDSTFKVPMGVPKAKKKGPDNLAGSSKSVHFDVESSNSTNDSLSDSDVFKTPPKKGCVAAETSEKKMLKTPITCRKEPFAVVTPGPMMNKTVQVLRLPEAGETAVSLSGSPLLVTPFGANGSSQALLTVASENGKLMTIVQPKELQDEPTCTSSPRDSEMFSLLNDEAKQKIKQFASYLLNNIK